MEYAITTSDLTKKYGRRAVVNQVNLHLREGEIYGFIGRNGAGKTTCMKILAGLANPTSGEYTLLDKNGKEGNVPREKVGNLIESPGIIKSMSGFDNLMCLCLAKGIDDANYVNELLEIVGLQDASKKKAGKYSLGMRQRLGIAMALVGEPKILLLDEPINGLDPQGIADMRELFVKLRDEKKMTILISSHILDELARVADRFGIINRGELVAELTKEELRENCSSRIRLQVDNGEKTEKLIKDYGIEKYEIKENGEIEIAQEVENTAKLNRYLMENGVEVAELAIIQGDLESYYLSLTQ